MAQNPDGAQEQLFGVANRTDQMAMPVFDSEMPDDVRKHIETSIHFINALDGISTINSQIGFVAAASTKTHRPRLEEEYTGRLEFATDAVKAKFKRMGSAVKWSFARAIGMFDEPDLDAAKERARTEFDEFRNKYDGTGAAVARNNHISLLQKGIEHAVRDYSEFKRVKKAGIPAVAAQIEIEKIEEDDGMQLNTPERLRAIYEDPRAGFIPTHNTEKNIVIAFLDYMDNPDLPYGIKHQFEEIFHRQERVYKKNSNGVSAKGDAGNEALVSITHQLIDYWQNANSQVAALKELQIALAEPYSPDLQILDLINHGDIEMYLQGFAAMVRFNDQRAVMNSNNARAPGFKMSPMRTIRNEDPSLPVGKNKIHEDCYTGQNPHPSFAKRIRYQAYQMNVKDARKLINEALANEEKRQYFMRNQLTKLKTSNRPRVRDLVKSVLAPVTEAA